MQNTPIQTFIQKFRIQQVKSQLIRGLFQLAIGGIMSLLILSILESIYYFSTPIRSSVAEFFILLFFIFVSYFFLRAYFHSKSLFNNSSNYFLANLFKDRDPDISDRLLNALQLEEALDEMETGKDLAEYAIQKNDSKLETLPVRDRDLAPKLLIVSCTLSKSP